MLPACLYILFVSVAFFLFDSDFVGNRFRDLVSSNAGAAALIKGEGRQVLLLLYFRIANFFLRVCVCLCVWYVCVCGRQL